MRKRMGGRYVSFPLYLKALSSLILIDRWP